MKLTPPGAPPSQDAPHQPVVVIDWPLKALHHVKPGSSHRRAEFRPPPSTSADGENLPVTLSLFSFYSPTCLSPLPTESQASSTSRAAGKQEQGSRRAGLRQAELRRAEPGGRRDPASRAWRGVGMAGAAMAAGTRSLGPTEAGAQAPAMASREDGSSARLPGRSSGGQEGAGGPIGGRMARRSATASLPKERSDFPNAIAKRARCRIRWKLIFEGVRFFYRC